MKIIVSTIFIINSSFKEDSFFISLFCSIIDVSFSSLFNLTIFSLLPNFLEIIFLLSLFTIYSSGVIIPPTTLSPNPKLEVITASS